MAETCARLLPPTTNNQQPPQAKRQRAAWRSDNDNTSNYYECSQNTQQQQQQQQQQDMSRFWAAGGSSEEDSDQSSGSSDASSDFSDDGGARGGAGNNNRWLVMSDSESSEDEVRVVKSGKERAMLTFQKLIKDLRKHMKDRDYWELQNSFDELSKSMIKAKQYLVEGVPRQLVRILVDLEDYVAERLTDKAQFKKLSARQGRALNRMKLTLKKHNKAYSVVMVAYRKNPDTDDPFDADDASEDEDEKSSSSSSSSSSSGSDSDKASKKDSGSDKDSDKVSQTRQHTASTQVTMIFKIDFLVSDTWGLARSLSKRWREVHPHAG
jgi:hypothetical protein